MREIFSKRLKGFTLIELIVVMGIIGLLVSLASVTALEFRKKGRDAGIQASLTQVRAEATLIKNDTYSYTAVCDSDTLNDAAYPNTLGLIESETEKYNGNQPIDCFATTDAYCVQSPLNLGIAYCIDSTGYAGKDKRDCDSAHFNCDFP